jgi:hypothetical protein
VLPDRAVVPITGYDQLQPSRRLPIDAVEVPAAAATSMPPSLAAAVTLTRSAPAVGAGSPVTHGSPVAIPAPRAPLASPAFAGPPESTPSEFTEAGLPRRPSDTAPLPVDASDLPRGMPDPETVRARLSSLASGIAAAHRDTPPPSTAPPSQ